MSNTTRGSGRRLVLRGCGVGGALLAGGVAWASGTSVPVLGDRELVTLDGLATGVLGGPGLQPAGGESAVLVQRTRGSFALLRRLPSTPGGAGIFDGVYSAGTQPMDGTMGDLDGDGDADLVFGIGVTDRATVVWNRGEDFPSGGLRFSFGGTLTLGGGVSGVAIGDVNGDGRADIVSANRSDHSFTVMGGLPAGEDGAVWFGSLGRFGTTAFGPSGVAIADFDRDGATDIAVSGSQADAVGVHFGAASATGGVVFGAAEAYGVGGRPTGLFALDVDLDGWVDLVSVNELSSSLSVLLNRRDGTFAPAAGVATASGLTDAAAGDVDGDLLVDFVVSTSSGLVVLMNDGRGGFERTVFPTPVTIGRVALADLGGSGLPDVIGSALQSELALVWENLTTPADVVACPGDADGDGRVGAGDLFGVLAEWGCASACDVGDVDGDGAVGVDDLMLVLSRFGSGCGAD